MMRFFPFLIISILLLSCTGEKKRRKEITGNWTVISKETGDSNFLSYTIPDTLISNLCTVITGVNKKVEIEYRFMDRNKAMVIETHHDQFIDTASLTNCIPQIRDTNFTMTFNATWDIEGKDNLLVIYNNQVENIIIREFSKTSMKWDKEINVSGGFISFNGVVTYALEKR